VKKAHDKPRTWLYAELTGTSRPGKLPVAIKIYSIVYNPPGSMPYKSLLIVIGQCPSVKQHIDFGKTTK
jgi:hypothetical protein